MGQGPQDTLRSAFVRPTFRDFVGPTQPASAPPRARWQQVLGDALVGGTDVFGELSGLYPLLDLIGVPTPQSQSRQAGELLAAAVPVLGATKALRVANPIKAYHGSPHDFDQFSLSKIGTGEGAQAYGHGLYFADSEGVAKSYRDGLTRPDVFIADQKVLTDPVSGGVTGINRQSPEGIAAMALQVNPNPASAIDDLKHRPTWYGGDHSGGHALRQAAAELIGSGRVRAERAGRMYEVNIHANPDDFLDWDAPISRQSDHVRTALGDIQQTTQAFSTRPTRDGRVEIMAPTGDSMGFYHPSEVDEAMRNLTDGYMRNVGGRELTGGDVIERLRKIHPGTEQSALSERGIPGIKYYDGMSRGAKEGTRNYVVFDDRLVEIVKKYGIAGAVSAGLLNEIQARQFRDAGYQ